MDDRLIAIEPSIAQGISWRDIAWFFEGEGSVGYYRVNPKGDSHRLFVRLTSSNWWLLDLISRSIEPRGSVLRGGKPGCFSGGVLHKKGSWNLTWTCGKAVHVITHLVSHLPSCSEKRPQIEFCLRIGKCANRLQADELKAMKSYTSAK